MLALAFGTTNAGACTMVCNDQVNVSLPADCAAEITYDMILEDPNNPLVCTPNGPTAYVVIVMNQYGQVIPTSPVVTSDYIGQFLTVKVKHWASGNSCWGTILVEDKLAPQLTCPPDITIQCSDPTDTLFTGALIADDCSDFNTNFTDQLETFGCNNPIGILTRTFTGMDVFGNFSSCVQKIFIEKPLTSSVQFPPNRDGITGTALPCENPNTDPSNTGWPTINGSPVQNGGLCNMAITYDDTQLNICDGTYKILRKWTVADWCTGLIATHTQIIKVEDSKGPELTCPPNQTVGTTGSLTCEASVILPPVGVTDNCSNTFTYQITSPGPMLTTNGGLVHNLAPGTYPITYTVFDGCGNASTCQMNLTVVDDDAPAVICDEFTVVTLQSDGFVNVFATTFDDGTYDNCCLDHFEARRMVAGCGVNATFGPQVTFCCEDIGEDVQVEFRAVDCAGNANSCMVTVHVDDKSNPVIVCPPNKTISCTEDYTDLNLTGEATAFDGCGTVNLTHTDQVNLTTCHEGTVVRTWTVTDNFGNSASCTQLITIVDNTPVTVTFPLNYDLVNGCTNPTSLHPDSLPAPYNKPVIAGDDCELVGVNYDDQVFQIAPPACFKIVRTWTLIDWCAYVPNSGSNAGFFEHQQILKVFDNEAPVLTCPDDLTVEISGTDCVATVELPNATVTDCSQNTTITVSGDLGIGQGPFNNVNIGEYIATYQATDGCGNSSNCQINITVIDGKKPTPYCKSGLIIELMQTGMVDVWASDFDNGSFDNCPGDLQLSFSADVNDISTTFDCDQVGQQNIELWVTDASGNQDFCSTFVIIQDNMNACGTTAPLVANVSGMVTDEAGSTVENVTISVNDGITAPITTTGSGHFQFTGLPMGNDYTVSPEKNANYLNGVTTWDLVLLRKHILFMELLDSPYKIIAADANHSGTVTTSDMVELHKLILFINDSLPNNTSWRFVDKNYVFQDPAHPLDEIFPEVYNINNLSEDMTVNFIGIKIGDLNNSAMPNMLAQTGDRNNSETLAFRLRDQHFEAGDLVRLDFHAGDFEDIQGYQFTLNFDPTALQFEAAEPGLLPITPQHFGTTLSPQGILTTAWFADQAVAADENAVLFSLRFRATHAGTLRKAVHISSDRTTAEAYRADGEPLNVALEYENEPDELNTFELLPNQPNPFRSVTQISFRLPEASSATLRVFDISGNLLWQKTDLFDKGLNHITINASQWPATGTLLYRLETATHTATGKMVLIR